MISIRVAAVALVYSEEGAAERAVGFRMAGGDPVRLEGVTAAEWARARWIPMGEM